MYEATNSLPLRSSFVRDEFAISTSANVIAPSLPILFSVLSENEISNELLLQRLSELMDELSLNASDNFIAPLLSILLPVLSENELKTNGVTAEIEKSN
jgi:hypothetical protein